MSLIVGLVRFVRVRNPLAALGQSLDHDRADRAPGTGAAGTSSLQEALRICFALGHFAQPAACRGGGRGWPIPAASRFRLDRDAKSAGRRYEAAALGRGGSTITQQLVKNLFLTTERSFVRKGVESSLVPLVEAFLTKDRILELYLNVIEWGPGIYGAEAASEHYYHAHASELTREQAARLAAIIPAPLKRKPGADERIQRRSSWIAWSRPDGSSARIGPRRGGRASGSSSHAVRSGIVAQQLLIFVRSQIASPDDAGAIDVRRVVNPLLKLVLGPVAHENQLLSGRCFELLGRSRCVPRDRRD